MRFGVWGWGLGSGVRSLGFGVWGVGCGVHGFGVRVDLHGELRVRGARVVLLLSCLVLSVSGFGFGGWWVGGLGVGTSHTSRYRVAVCERLRGLTKKYITRSFPGTKCSDKTRWVFSSDAPPLPTFSVHTSIVQSVPGTHIYHMLHIPRPVHNEGTRHEFHMQTLIIYKLGFNQNYCTFTLI